MKQKTYYLNKKAYAIWPLFMLVYELQLALLSRYWRDTHSKNNKKNQKTNVKSRWGDLSLVRPEESCNCEEVVRDSLSARSPHYLRISSLVVTLEVV